MGLRLKCSCGIILHADAAMVGKRGKCKKCDRIFTVPTPKALKPKNKPSCTESTASESNRSERAKPPTPPKKSLKKCPYCRETIGDVIVCIHCGYHTKLKRKLETLDQRSVAKSKWLIAASIIPFSLLYVGATCYWLDAMDGPTFLKFFFAGFCGFGILTPVLRYLWHDTDVVNVLATVTLELAGLIRLGNALMDQNYRIGFLLLGLILIPLVFLLPRTENNNEFSESFRTKHGRLALVPYACLFGLVAAGLATVYFVPVVRVGVASLSLGADALLGLIVFGTLNPSLMNSLGGSQGAYSGSSSSLGCSSFSGCSSCSSCGGGGGCGGGCGGGGCGGCGG